MNDITKNIAKISTKFKMWRKNIKSESWFFDVIVKFTSYQLEKIRKHEETTN